MDKLAENDSAPTPRAEELRREWEIERGEWRYDQRVLRFVSRALAALEEVERERDEADAERNVANGQLALIEEAMLRRGIFPKRDAQPHEVLVCIIENLDEAHVENEELRTKLERVRKENAGVQRARDHAVNENERLRRALRASIVTGGDDG